ncbi:hypothetical protein ACFLS9_05430 [Bacteroidota bacterium]
MTRRKIYGLIFFLLIISVPWFFTGFSKAQILGLPIWGFYSFVISILFAVVVVFVINKYWETLRKNDDVKEDI